MPFAMRTGTLTFLVIGLLVGHAAAENEGVPDLDLAADTKLTATSLSDLTEVIRLLESALEKGLDEGNAQFAKQMLASTRFRRGLDVTETIFGSSPPDPRWPDFRRLALGDLERGLELDPEHPQAWMAVAQLNLLPGGDSERVGKALDQVIALAEEDPKLKSKALMFRSGISDDAEQKLADLDEAIRTYPANVAALRARVVVLSGQRKWEAALADVDAALKFEPNHAPTLLERGVLLIDLERYDEALESLDRAHELAPNSAMPLVRRGQALGMQEKYAEALEALNEAYVLEPGNLVLLLVRASVYQELDQTDKALADVDQVLKLKPGLGPAIQLRVRLLAGSGEFDEAIAQLEALQESDPEDVDVALQLAMFYNAEKWPRKAIEIYGQILADHPENGMALHGRADALLAIGEHARAVADYEKALELLPDDAGLLNNFAWVLATSPDEKIRDGRRALELASEACRLTDHKMAHILSTLASAHAEVGDFEAAVKWSAKAVELGDESQKEQLAKELKSYRKKKPWRERQETPEGGETETEEEGSDEAPEEDTPKKPKTEKAKGQ